MSINMDKAILMPSNKELEKKIIWYLIVYPENASDIFLLLSFDYFRNSDYNYIIRKIYKMFKEWKEIDIINLVDEFHDDIPYQRLWWREFICDATDEVRFDSLDWAFDIIKRLKKYHMRREVLKEANRIQHIVINDEDLENEITKSFDTFNNILSFSETKVTNMEDNISILEQTIEQNKEKDLVWYASGFDWIDEHTWWIRKGKTYRIWGLSGVGKTSLIYQIIDSVLSQDAKVLFVSLENSIDTTLIKFLSCVQRENPKNLEKWIVKPDYDYLRKVENNFKITDSLFSLDEIKREILKTKPDLVILDYIGLVNINSFSEETKYNEYADNIRQFVQKNSSFAYLDISNLWKADNEFTIREYKAFNWSAKLRNNTDFWMHLFPYSNFEKYKTAKMKTWNKQEKSNLYWKKVVTFFISKNRFWEDNIEKQYCIDFNKWIRFYEIKEEDLIK